MVELLNEFLCGGAVFERDDEYLIFYYPDDDLSFKQLNKHQMNKCFNLIREMCNSTYWICIHSYIRGHDTNTGEEYCITNDSLDIPFRKISAYQVQKCFWNIFFTLMPNSGMSSEWASYKSYFDSVQIDYMKIVMKRTKKGLKSKRKSLSGKTRINVLERDGYTCQMCGATIDDGVKLHIDHIIPVSKGGTNDMDNLQVLCHKCNLAKHDRMDLKATREKLGE